MDYLGTKFHDTVRVVAVLRGVFSYHTAAS